jgi:hypothetical protein
MLGKPVILATDTGKKLAKFFRRKIGQEAEFA